MKVVRSGGFAPEGERRLRLAAKLAGFDGTVLLKGGPRIDSDGMMTWGQFDPPNHITLWTTRKAPINLLDVFLHECGHADRYRRGKYSPASNYRDRASYNHDPEERAAERFAKRVRGLLP